MSSKVVIIPTFNEKENVEAIIKAVLTLKGGYDVLIVDDNSPDGTANIVEEMQQNYKKRIHLIKRIGKKGLGTAYIAGFREAISLKYDYIFEMDADFSHNPLDLERLYEACENGADVAIGSRYVDGGGFKNWGWDRIFLSKGASFYVKLITWMPIKDPTAGFIAYKRKVLETIKLEDIEFVGYAFQIEMKYAAFVNGFSIKEIPITFKDREKGTSKMNLSIISEALPGVLKIRLKKFLGKYKR